MGEEVQEMHRLYQENLDHIYHFVYSKVGNRQEAEDLTSQVFLKAVRSLDPERTPQSMRTWLFQIARTTMADYWRAYYRENATSLDELLETGWEGPTEEEYYQASNGIGSRVHDILHALSKRDQEVLTYRFLLDLSIRETALKMGLTETNVKVMQYRALKRAADVEQGATGSASNA